MCSSIFDSAICCPHFEQRVKLALSEVFKSVFVFPIMLSFVFVHNVLSVVFPVMLCVCVSSVFRETVYFSIPFEVRLIRSGFLGTPRNCRISFRMSSGSSFIMDWSISSRT